MELPFFTCLLLLAVGACAGLLTSTLGIGGSLVVVPALLLVLPLLHIPEGLTPTMALGTSLTVSLATALFSAWEHWRLKNLNDPFSPDKLALMLCAGLGAVAGAAMVNSVRPAIALAVIACAQLYFGVGILRPKRKAQQAAAGAFNSRSASSRLFFGVVGLLTGMGAGGSLIVPYLSVKGVEHRQAVALAGWLGVLIGAAALSVYASRSAQSHLEFTLGAVHVPAALLIAAGSFGAVKLGAGLASRVDAKVLRLILGVLLIASAARISFRLVV